MRKVLGAAALLLLLAGSQLEAQTSASGTANVNVTVTSGLSVSNTAAIDFGTMTSGTNKTLAFDAATTGKFTVSGAASASTQVTFSVTTQPTIGATTLTFVPAVYTNTSNAAANNAVTSGATLALHTDGFRYFFVGGTLTVPTGVSGTATAGVFTLSVQYN